MKNNLMICICFCMITSIELHAQTRKYVTQFSHLQGYFNPALTGYEGSMFRGFVRDQWAGWEGAPKTYFASAEFDFGQLTDAVSGDILGKNAAGISILHDQYGAFAETELLVNYASRIQVGEKSNLRLGMGISYQSIRLDGNNLTTEQAADPTVGQYFGSFSNMQVVDFNVGVAITHPSYYVSYALHNANEGAISSGDVFMDRLPRAGIFQAGYRNKLSDNLSVASNFMFRSQADLPDNIEFNFKVVMMEKIWLGAGHRVDYANNFQLGLLWEKVRIGYVYEMPMVKSYLLSNVTHEFLLSYSLFGNNRKGMIW
jgi:type IX secretion system PorP/SprF family membrane protein